MNKFDSQRENSSRQKIFQKYIYNNFYYSMNKIISDFNEIHRKIDKMPKKLFIHCNFIFFLPFG